MMRVRMTTQISGSRPDGSPWPQPGTEFEVSEEEAAFLFANEMAVPAAEARAEERKAEKRPAPEDPKVETRQDAAPEKEVPDPAKQRGPGRSPKG